MKFVGDPVALVVAASRYIAEDAVELVDVDYEPLPAVADFTKAVNSEVVVHDEYPDNVAGGMGGAPPDEETFSSAAHVASAHVYQQIYAPVPIETRGLVAEWEASSRELTMWASTQTPHELRAFAARLLGIPRRTSESSCATPAVGSARRSSRCVRTCASCWPPTKCRVR